MNFNYEQIKDMAFPCAPTAGRLCVSPKNEYCTIQEDLWPVNFLSYYIPVPTVEEVYATLRSGLFLKYVHNADKGQVFQFWLSDPGFPDKFYASGRDLCEVVCNAYLRSKMKPNNPQPFAQTLKK